MEYNWLFVVFLMVDKMMTMTKLTIVVVDDDADDDYGYALYESMGYLSNILTS